MKIGVDTNILFSFFWQESLTRKLLIASNFELVSPKIALEEIEKYSQEIKKKLKITEREFREQFEKLKEIVKFIDKKEYSQFLKEVEFISPDKNDAEFFALCIKNSCFLWNNDSILKKQDRIKVFSTNEIIELIF